jgi:chlorobactene glucosyltransferase
MLYQGIIALCLTVFMVNLILNLRALHKLGDEKEELPEPLPLISILIPARDEESNIVTCLESLQGQDYPNYEILVLDDSSSDNTAAVVEQIAASDPRVRLLRGKPLPQRWAGKPFACHQLASQAAGSWLLFTDADTIHAPAMLRSALSYAHNNRLALLSGLPLQHSVSFSERVVIPVMYFIILSWFPLWWLQGSARLKPGLAIGQFLFLSAREYRDMGGHEAVKSRILEDVWLGFEMARHKKRQATVDLSQMVACRMYEGLGDLWEGFTRFIYSVASLSTWILGLMMLAGFGLFVAPFLWVAWHFLAMSADYDWLLLIIIIQLLVIMLMRGLIDHRFHHSRLYSLSHPVGVSFMLLAGVCGVAKRFTGAGVYWKQRRYIPESGIE